jgi:hypothetical protein
MASFTAAKRLVYRLQTHRLPPPNYPFGAAKLPECRHPNRTSSLFNIKCKRLHKKFSEIYLAVLEKCINFAARSYN